MSTVAIVLILSAPVGVLARLVVPERKAAWCRQVKRMNRSRS